MEQQEPTRQIMVHETIEVQESVLDRQLDWIRGIDGKTPAIMGLATAMLTALAAVSPPAQMLTWLPIAAIVAGATPQLGCLVFCAIATFPQTAGPNKSMIFFGGIADTPVSQYAAKVRARTADQHLDDLSLQVHRNAQIASAKYAAVQKAMLCLFVGTPIWLISAYFLFKG